MANGGAREPSTAARWRQEWHEWSGRGEGRRADVRDDGDGGRESRAAHTAAEARGALTATAAAAAAVVTAKMLAGCHDAPLFPPPTGAPLFSVTRGATRYTPRLPSRRPASHRPARRRGGKRIMISNVTQRVLFSLPLFLPVASPSVSFRL